MYLREKQSTGPQPVPVELGAERVTTIAIGVVRIKVAEHRPASPVDKSNRVSSLHSSISPAYPQITRLILKKVHYSGDEVLRAHSRLPVNNHMGLLR